MIKVKGRRDFPELAERIDGLSRHWPHLMWRIDFNEVLTRDETLEFVQGMTDQVRKRIDFLEDPCPWKEEDWDEIRRVARLQLASRPQCSLAGSPCRRPGAQTGTG